MASGVCSHLLMVSSKLTSSFVEITSFLYNLVQVPPGDYRLSALAAKPESASGLMFLPSYIDVVIKNPVLNVEFSQVTLGIRGSSLGTYFYN